MYYRKPHKQRLDFPEMRTLLRKLKHPLLFAVVSEVEPPNPCDSFDGSQKACPSQFCTYTPANPGADATCGGTATDGATACDTFGKLIVRQRVVHIIRRLLLLKDLVNQILILLMLLLLMLLLMLLMLLLMLLMLLLMLLMLLLMLLMLLLIPPLMLLLLLLLMLLIQTHVPKLMNQQQLIVQPNCVYLLQELLP